MGALAVLSLVGVAAYVEEYGTQPELGQEIYATTEPGEISETSYLARPASADSVQKVAYVTGVGDQVRAVGYCKQS